MNEKILTISNYSKGYIKVVCDCNTYLIGLDDDIESIISIENISDDGFVVAMCKVKDFDRPLIKWIELGNLIHCKDKDCAHPNSMTRLKFV